jgi:hypothetical protein
MSTEDREKRPLQRTNLLVLFRRVRKIAFVMTVSMEQLAYHWPDFHYI